jgi:hypothetical protein
MELSSKRLYDLWSGLGELLRTGRPQAVEEQGQNEFFATLYRDPEALRNFLSGMTGISTGEATLIAARFPWKRFKTFVDVGAAQGALPVRVALTHPHLTGASYDLAAVGPIFEEYVASFGLSDRLRFLPGNMHEGPLPAADVLSFGHLLHGYGEAKRRDLIARAYAALAGRRLARLRRDDRPAAEQLRRPALQPEHHARDARGLRGKHRAVPRLAGGCRLRRRDDAARHRADVDGVRAQAGAVVGQCGGERDFHPTRRLPLHWVPARVKSTRLFCPAFTVTVRSACRCWPSLVHSAVTL